MTRVAWRSGVGPAGRILGAVSSAERKPRAGVAVRRRVQPGAITDQGRAAPDRGPGKPTPWVRPRYPRATQAPERPAPSNPARPATTPTAFVTDAMAQRGNCGNWHSSIRPEARQEGRLLGAGRRRNFGNKSQRFGTNPRPSGTNLPEHGTSGGRKMPDPKAGCATIIGPSGNVAQTHPSEIRRRRRRPGGFQLGEPGALVEEPSGIVGLAGSALCRRLSIPSDEPTATLSPHGPVINSLPPKPTPSNPPGYRRNPPAGLGQPPVRPGFGGHRGVAGNGEQLGGTLLQGGRTSAVGPPGKGRAGHSVDRVGPRARPAGASEP